jgi:hypothetical protein
MISSYSPGQLAIEEKVIPSALIAIIISHLGKQCKMSNDFVVASLLIHLASGGW